MFAAVAGCSVGFSTGHLHAHHIFDVEVVEWSDVGVFTMVRLQHQLLDDPVQHHPVLTGASVLLICKQTSQLMQSCYRLR